MAGEEVDDWAPIAPAAPVDDWAPVGGAEPPPAGSGLLRMAGVPDAFFDRVRMGQAMTRILSKASEGVAEGWGETTPTGVSNEFLDGMAHLGIFHDPTRGRPGPLQLVNEAVIMPTAVAFNTLMRGLNAGFHGAGGFTGQLLEELGTEQGMANRARNEVINAGNWAMIEAGFGRFSRPRTPLENEIRTLQRENLNAGPRVPVYDEIVGGLPRADDFKVGAEVLAGRGTITVRAGGVESRGAGADPAVVEGRLQQLWQERGITPAEAVADAQRDVWLKNELTAPLPPPPEPVSVLGAPERIVSAAVRTEDGIIGGQTHASAWNIAKDKGIDVAKLAPDDVDGFVTSTGRYVSREEASKIADAAEQTRERGQARLESSTVHYQAGELRVLTRDEAVQLRPDIPEQRIDAKYYVVGDDGTFGGFNDLAAAERAAGLDLKAVDAKVGRIISGQEEGAIPRGLGADVTRDPPLVSPEVQPLPPPGTLAGAFQTAANGFLDITRDIQMLASPMVTGTRDTMAMAKDFMNSLRRNRWEWSRADDYTAKKFNPEQRKRMWMAADEESVARQLGESREHQGLVTLEPVERAWVENLQARAQTAWVRAVDLGMVEGEGLPAYTPRMMVNMATAGSQERALALNSIGTNLRATTGGLKKRKYMTAEETETAGKQLGGAEAELARDIRVLPLATAKLEDAIAGRTLVNNIKDYGKSAGKDVVAEGFKPDPTWFTIDHPALKTWRPKLKEKEGGGWESVKDADGNVIFEQVPLYIHADFKGPLTAVLQRGQDGATYAAMMELKAKTMSLIMNSPMIHNAVEWGRALFAMPGKVATFRVYFEGNAARQGVPYTGVVRHVMDWKTGKFVDAPATMNPLMVEAINSGLVPIGKRFFNQDITAIMEAPDLAPGRSLTSKVLAAVPGLFDEGAAVAVKRSIDKAGDFWHNTLLWDRVADLQMGLYVNFRRDLMAKGVDQQTSSRAAAHWANRYAGALPQEAMSDNARKIANMLMFSRSFTLGNVGVMKDMLNGLPRDVMAQISRDVGNLDPKAAGYIKSMAVRKAVAIVALDMAGMYVMNSLLQNASNVVIHDSTVDAEMRGYAERLQHAATEVGEHPLRLLQPFHMIGSLSATSEGEPGKEARVLVGYTKDGTAIYARSPVGKIGEEFEGYLTGPLDMLRRKQGTVARPVWQIMSNDAGFGRKIYDPNADTPAKYLKNIGLVVAHLVKAQFPEGQLSAAADLVKGEGDTKLNILQAFGPVAGATFSKGAPGGPAVGELYAERSQHQYAVDSNLADIRRRIQRGDIAGAQEVMRDLGIPPGLQRFYIRTSINPSLRLSPKAVRDFYLRATPEQQRRLESAR